MAFTSRSHSSRNKSSFSELYWIRIFYAKLNSSSVYFQASEVTNCISQLRAYLAALGLPTNTPECSHKVWSRNGREGCSGMLHDVVTQMVYRPIYTMTTASCYVQVLHYSLNNAAQSQCVERHATRSRKVFTKNSPRQQLHLHVRLSGKEIWNSPFRSLIFEHTSNKT